MAFGNILIGGVIGVGVDVATGAAYDYPDLITVQMTSLTAPPLPASLPLPLAAPALPAAPLGTPVVAPVPVGPAIVPAATIVPVKAAAVTAEANDSWTVERCQR